MFERLRLMAERYAKLAEMLADPEIIADQKVWREYAKEHASLEEAVNLYNQYLAVQKNTEECKEMMNGDDELAEMAKEEFKEGKAKLEELTQQLKLALLPVDPHDQKNVIVEIRAAAGGEESALFGAELLRMYRRYAERKRWKYEEVNVELDELGGIEECTFQISGAGAFSKLKFESGVHRVQRVPATESQGRVHTSTATVAVLPEVEDVEIDISEKDVKVDTYRSSGAGGQKVNKTETAIRLTHIPTGLVVTSQDERSQLKNKEKAFQVLRSRLYEYYKSKADSEYASERKSQVGSGDRSEKIRTYNFPQNRVTDHRIGYTMYNLEGFMDGDMEDMLDALQLAKQNELLASVEG